jgi:hypothetical protein
MKGDDGTSASGGMRRHRRLRQPTTQEAFTRGDFCSDRGTNQDRGGLQDSTHQSCVSTQLLGLPATSLARLPAIPDRYG